ncbi:MAG: DUF1641 domain-containing protein [Acidimicrobiia bacterium]|nr:DUF1641 domain-containing protein [Acidimicrobiia bacterium]
MTTAAPARPEELEAKIDALTEQVAFLAEEARLARQRREMWVELQEDMMPIAGDVLQVLERELEELSADVTLADIGDLVRRFIRVAPILDRALNYVESFAELFEDMMPLTEHAMDVATDRLVNLDQKGYFTFAKAGVHVVDRVVTGFSEEDVEALGDNVVLILETIKEMTQPEIMAILYRMIEAVQRQQAQLAEEPEEPPSLFGLLRRMRDPEIRRGLGRALNTLSAVSDVDTGPPRRFVHTNDQKQDADSTAGGK